MFFLCFTFQVRASSLCNRSRRAAKAAAKALEGVGVVGLFNGYVDWYHLAFFVGWFLHFGKKSTGDDRRLSDADSEPQAEIQGRMTFESIWGAFLQTPRESTQRVRFHTDNETSFFLAGQAKGSIFFWGLYVFTLKAPCVDSFIPQCGGCVHSWKLRQILSQSSNPRGEHHSWSMKVKRKIGRWAWSEHAMICLAGKEDELRANDSLIFG